MLVAEDLAAPETSADSLAVAVSASAHAQHETLPGKDGFSEERTRQGVPEAVPGGAVAVGSPVAPPVNGDLHSVSSENVMLHGSR